VLRRSWVPAGVEAASNMTHGLQHVRTQGHSLHVYSVQHGHKELSTENVEHLASVLPRKRLEHLLDAMIARPRQVKLAAELVRVPVAVEHERRQSWRVAEVAPRRSRGQVGIRPVASAAGGRRARMMNRTRSGVVERERLA